MQQGVVQRDPDFPVCPVNAHRREDSLERGLLPLAFLAHDLLARSLCRGHGLERSVLNILSRVAQGVILPHRGLRHVCKRIITLPLLVRGKLPDIQIAVQLGALRKRFRVAELAHVPSILIENDHQVRLAEPRPSDLALRPHRKGDRPRYPTRSKRPATYRRTPKKTIRP